MMPISMMLGTFGYNCSNDEMDIYNVVGHDHRPSSTTSGEPPIDSPSIVTTASGESTESSETAQVPLGHSLQPHSPDSHGWKPAKPAKPSAPPASNIA